MYFAKWGMYIAPADTVHGLERAATADHRSHMVTNTTIHNPTCGLDHSRAYCPLLTLPTLPTLADASQAA